MDVSFNVPKSCHAVFHFVDTSYFVARRNALSRGREISMYLGEMTILGVILYLRMSSMR